MSNGSDARKTYDFETDVFPAELKEIARRRIELGRRRKRLALEQALRQEGLTDPAEIERRRKLLEAELASLTDPFKDCDRKPSLQLGLVGLAISGGGIRSATSALGVIQTLAQKNLLQEMDYLSTVSGGGFTGSCLSSLLSDPRTGPTRESFPLLDDPGKKEHPALSHLRNASRYLAPGGLLDRLRIPALLVRGILNNFAIFLLLIMVLVMVTQVGYQLAWKHGLDIGNTLLWALLGFVLLPMIFPLAARFSGRLSWSRRNFSGWLFSMWLLVLLGVLALIPLAILVNDATHVNLAELKAILVDELSRPFELRDIYKWLVIAAIIVLFMAAGRASQTVAKLRSRLVLLAVGLLAPAILLAVYLGIIVSELDSGLIATKPLFEITAGNVGYMLGERDQDVRQRLQAEFAKNGILLSPSFSLVPVDELRWVISDGDRFYRLTRDRDEFHVDHDFAYPLERGTVSPALRDALGVKGYPLSRNVQVISYTGDNPGIAEATPLFPTRLLFEVGTAEPDASAIKDIGKIAAYAKARPAERLQVTGVGRSAGHAEYELAGKRARAVAERLQAGVTGERDRIDLSRRIVADDTAGSTGVNGWVEVDVLKTGADRTSSPAEDTYYLSGRREIAVLPQQPHWTIAMVVHPNLAVGALERASSTLNRFVFWPFLTPIHKDAQFSGDDVDAALRFVKEGRQQDIVLVIEETARPRDLYAKTMAAIRAATEGASGFHRHTTKGMQVAVFHLLGKDLTFYEYAALPDMLSGGPIGEKRDLKEACSPSAPAGPAALLCAMRHARAHGRHGTDRSVWFVGSGSARFDPGAHGDWGAKTQELRHIPIFAIDVEADASPDCGSATPAGACNFLRPIAGYEKTSANVPEWALSAELRAAAMSRLAFFAARSPQRESVRVVDRRSPTESYTLFREGSYVRIEAQVVPPTSPLPALSAMEADDKPPAPLSSFLAGGGLYLSPSAYVSKGEAAGPSYREHPCVDHQGMAWRVGCVQINDPYLLEVTRVHGGLVVGDLTDRPAWMPASLVWDDRVQWPWTIVFMCLVAYWFYFNVNTTSLNRFYRDRLSKAYLFGIDRRRGSRRKGELFANDGQKLSGLNRDGSAAPYHLINVALNLADSRAEDLRGRDADFFLLSKHFVGSPRVGFVPTKVMEKCDPNLNLGTAMAISGAAAAPNMGASTVRLLVFIMTLLNLRLGYWLPNPRAVGRRLALRRVTWRLGPGPGYLLKEAMGWVNERSDYINLTDGGHIENLGIYELLRRRCKCIIAIDGEADPELRFNGLITLLRYARIDFGIKIEFDLEPLLDDIRSSGDRRLSKQCWALGRIDYGNNEVGRLYYIKSAVTGTEPDYVKDYRQRYPEFPHESTAEQFFTESQFEAYRALGEHIGKALSEKEIEAFIKGEAAA